MAAAKVSFLVPDISCPVLGPVTVLARHLQPDFSVEIVGPDLGHGICEMYRTAFPYTAIPCPRIYRWPDYLWESRRLASALDGDVIVAVKAFASTVPVALRVKRTRSVKVVAYLDEWDGALMDRLSTAQRWKRRLRHAHHPLDDVYCPRVERLIPRCDQVISTTRALQQRFGGQVLAMGVDMNFFAPHPPDEKRTLRNELGLAGKKLIVFGGVVRPHKGIELILEALASIRNPQYALVIVGPKNEHVTTLQKHPVYSPYLISIGSRPKEMMPRYLDLADLIVLPLNDDKLAQTQMPCKVFEAMAMAKPIIGSAVSDLPEVLSGCGWTVPANNATALASRIEWVFNNPSEAERYGRQARDKCARHYSQPVVAQQLNALMENVMRG